MRQTLTILLLSSLFGLNNLVAQCDFDVYDGIMCDSSKFLCSLKLLDGHLDSLPEVNLNGPTPLCPQGGQVNNIKWFSFFPCAETVTFEITPFNCTPGSQGDLGVQAGIYSDCSMTDAIACMPMGTDQSFTITGTTFVPGELAYLFIDGQGESICEFEIRAIEGIESDTLEFEVDPDAPPAQDGGVTGVDSVCAGGSANYTFSVPTCVITSSGQATGGSCFGDLNIDDLVCYEWIILPDTGWYFVGDSTGPSIEVVWEIPGNYNVDVNFHYNPILSGCGSFTGATECGAFNSLDIEVFPPDIEVLPPVEICDGDCYEFCGELYCESIVVLCPDPQDSCKFYQQEITVKEMLFIDLGQYALCPGDCVQVMGQEYCVPGSYEVEDVCETYYFEINTIDMNLILFGTNAVTCENPTGFIEANAAVSGTASYVINWYQDNNFIGSGSVISGVGGGNYMCEVVVDGNVGSCQVSEFWTIVEDFEYPEIEIGPVSKIDCLHPSVILNASVLDPFDAVSWLGPNGFSSNDLNPSVSEIGSYHLTVVGSNGCESTAAINVEEDFHELEVSLQIPTLNCSSQGSVIQHTTDAVIVSYSWLGPNGFSSSAAFPIVTEAGNYQVEMVGENGCLFLDDFDITEDTDGPQISVGPNQLWTCESLQIIVVPDIDVVNYDVQWTSLDGIILSNDDQATLHAGLSGSYILEVTDALTNCTSLDTLLILEDPDWLQDAIVETIDPVCFDVANGSIQIVEFLGGTGSIEVYLDGESLGPQTSIENLDAGTYELTFVDEKGCELNKTITIQEASQVLLDVDPVIEVQYGEMFDLWVDTNLDADQILSIDWLDEQGNLLGQGQGLQTAVITDRIFRIELLDVNGCMHEAEIVVRVKEFDGVFVPNIFSPNEDGVNDRFLIYGKEVQGMVRNLRIYDRWGSLLYEGEEFALNDESAGWDGRYNGQLVSPSVYIYQASLSLTNGEEIRLKGDITLVR